MSRRGQAEHLKEAINYFLPYWEAKNEAVNEDTLGFIFDCEVKMRDERTKFEKTIEDEHEGVEKVRELDNGYKVKLEEGYKLSEGTTQKIFEETGYIPTYASKVNNMFLKFRKPSYFKEDEKE